MQMPLLTYHCSTKIGAVLTLSVILITKRLSTVFCNQMANINQFVTSLAFFRNITNFLLHFELIHCISVQKIHSHSGGSRRVQMLTLPKDVNVLAVNA